jgi:hypothetical protein
VPTSRSRSSWYRLACALALATLAGLALAGVRSQSASAALPGENLLQNPGAESAPGAPDAATIVPPPGWATTGEFTEVRYGASGGFPDVAVSAQIAGGANFFAGGNAAVSTGTQAVDVSAAATQIDANGAQATLNAYIGGFDSQNDSATVVAVYLDAGGNQLGAPVQIGPVTAADRTYKTTLLPRSTTAAVPAGTRQIRVVMTATRLDGSFNDGYIDNLRLSLSPQGAPCLRSPRFPRFHRFHRRCWQRRSTCSRSAGRCS